MRTKKATPGVHNANPRGQQGPAKQRVFRFYEGEYLEWQGRAAKEGVNLTQWMREAANERLRKS